MVVPLTLTVAILVLLEDAVTTPFPGRVTVIVPVLVALFRVRLDLFRVKLPAAFPMLQFTFLAPVPPSVH